MTDTVIARLRAIFVESLHIEAPSDETDLFDNGILDSLQLVELLLQLERCFGVRLALESLDLDNLRTLARIARLVAGSAETSPRTAQPSLREIRHDKAEKKAATG